MSVPQARSTNVLIMFQSELVRLFHNVHVDEAARVVEALADRTLPIVWSVGGKLRVLDPRMRAKERTLVLLYNSTTPVPEADLVRWVEHSNAAVFRRDVLKVAHREKLLEYDVVERTVEISPLGIQYVETVILAASA
jgi:hypothetical protein